MKITRELLRFKWVYDEGIVTLIDKKKGISFDLPITHLDSLLRAGIIFKNAHRNEQLLRQISRTNKVHLKLRKLELRIAEKRKKELLKKGIIPGQINIEGKEEK